MLKMFSETFKFFLFLGASSLFLCNFGSVTSYSMGAPDVACEDMTPGHGQTVREDVPPYNLKSNVTSVFSGEGLLLTLEAQDKPFKGFFIQARVNEDDNKPIGQFRLIKEGDHHLVTCKSGINNAVTHKTPDEKTSVTIEWIPPDNFEGDLLFRGTVVESFTTYWTSLRTNKVTVKKRSVDDSKVTETAKETTTSAPPVDTQNVATQQSSTVQAALTNLYNGCGKTKSCFGSPNNCEDKKNCRLMATYTQADNGKYEIELVGSGGLNRYVAFGLSFDNSMGDDGVVVCRSSGDSINVYRSWNEGQSNVEIRNPEEGVEELETGNIDSKLYCKFLLDEVIVVNNRKFELSNEKYHVMVAGASVSNDNRIQYHGPNKIVSAGLVSMGETSNLQLASDPHLFRILHGSFMICAWICTASCGILIARYFKRTWLNTRCCNIDMWFHSHRFFMVLTWSLTLAAVVLIWYGLKTFRPSYHSIIGMTSVVLCFIQPFLAAIRPPPGGEYRIVFNWLHWFIGNSAQILGITAIFLGYEMFLGEERNWVKEIAWYTLIAFIAFHCIIHLTLSIAQCISDRKPKSAEVFPLKELSNSRILYTDEDVRMDAPHGCFRKFILSIYLIINWAFTALLIILVVFEREEIENQLEKWNVPAFWEQNMQTP